MANKKKELELMLPNDEQNESDTAAASVQDGEQVSPLTGELPKTDDDDLNALLSNMDEPLEEFSDSTQPEDNTPAMAEASDSGLSTGEAVEEENSTDTEKNLPDNNETGLEKTAAASPKRTTRRKKAKEESLTEQPAAVTENEASDTSALSSEPSADEPVMKDDRRAASSRRPAKVKEAPVLTIESHAEVETQAEQEDVIWHEIHNAYRTRRILTGQLGGIEQTDAGKTVAIVDYKGFRIVIPMKEMMINLGRSPSGQEYVELMLRQNKILGNMLGAEIDFIVKGIDVKTRSVVASRQEAMLKKRQLFYMGTDASGMYRIYENRIVQARVIAVAEKVIRIEAFGAECSIMARDLAWDWIGDAHERFSVGDQVLVRILSVRRDSLEDIAIKADIKSVSQNTNRNNLKNCRIQSKYAGKVTDVHKGVVYIRLVNGVNAIAHSCYDYRTPGKKDDVSFAVTKLDEERGVAVGIITRIIKQHL
ncbi:MAG: S1 RNA-binding domain-containing protein [Clostridiaceae bacterium]|nr:S1 RNA-binding domain-containing protein [Clostridiaceae bacterium]